VQAEPTCKQGPGLVVTWDVDIGLQNSLLLTVADVIRAAAGLLEVQRAAT